MSGEYGASNGRLVNLPLNPPSLPCDPQQSARCHSARVDQGMGPVLDPLGEPGSGVGVPGAGVRIIDGGLDVASPFSLPPGAFSQDAGPQFAPVLGDYPSVVQLNTTLTFSLPASSRAVNPPSATRLFRANGWNAPGHGQAGRMAATTTPISAETQFTHDITLRYKAGPNAFGGTMAALQNGSGQLFLAATEPFNSATGSVNTSTYPYIGTNPLPQPVPNSPGTRHGAGWDYTRMGNGAQGIIRNLGGLAPPCTASLPPAPAGCGLVTDFTGFTIAVIPSAVTTHHLYAWTTGTVEVLLTGTLGAGVPNDQLLTAMGYDTISTSASGQVVRNIGLVAGSYTLRTSPGGARSGHQIIGLDMRFTPEPQTTAALVIGLGLLSALGAGRPARQRPALDH
ncbi:MAG: hypothetical protein AB8G23_23550 [Myxococcota bacterium]